MWKRIIYADWAECVPYVAFFLTFGVFLVLAIRALLMRKQQVVRLAHLPFEEQPGDRPGADSEDDLNDDSTHPDYSQDHE